MSQRWIGGELAFGHGDRASVRARNGRVAAHVIGMAMGVDDVRERLVAEPARRREQRKRQRRVADVSRVDQHVAVVAFQQHVVRRQPVANEDVKLRRQGSGGTGKSDSMAGCCHPTGQGYVAVGTAYIVPAARTKHPLAGLTGTCHWYAFAFAATPFGDWAGPVNSGMRRRTK